MGNLYNSTYRNSIEGTQTMFNDSNDDIKISKKKEKRATLTAIK